MNWKEFFKQNLMKSVVLTLVLLIISTLITFIIPLGIETYGIPFPRAGDIPSYGYFPPKTYSGIGFPLMFYTYNYEVFGPPENPIYLPLLYNYYNFIIDVIFWYIVSCLIIFIYNKSKKKRK